MTAHVMARAAFRAAAALIAIAAVIDPVMTVSRPAPVSVVIARLAASDVTAVENALRSASPEAEWEARRAADGRLPCAPGERCVMVADGSVDVRVPGDLAGPLSLVKVGAPAGPNVELQVASVSLTQQSGGSGTVRVGMRGAGMAGRRTDVRVTDGAATVGSAAHEWTVDGQATLDVPWWPLGDGPRALHVSAVPFDGESTAIDNAVTVGVNVSPARAVVLVFDVRPSWASTFARRALEDDPRFLVEHRVGLGPAVAAGTRAGRLDAHALNAASVAMIGSPDGLGASDVALLERFVRVRGGTLILLPDRQPTGPATRLFPGAWTEQLDAAGSRIGALRASEMLRRSPASPFDVILGWAMGSPVIVLSPSGSGRIVVSGAMDAWRYRDADGGAFDRFWRSLVLESAAMSPALALEFESAVAAPGGQVPIVVRHRRMGAETTTDVAATATCGAGSSEAVRLWPAGPDGVFTGTVAIDGGQPCRVEVAVKDGAVATGGLAVTTGAIQSVSAVMSKLESGVAQSGGVVADAGEEGNVASSLAGATASTVPTAVGPMRSPWWMFPFVTCLGVEWWLRRRAGLR